MQMVPVSAKAFGNFFAGDCYIILYVSTIPADFPRDHDINEGMSCMRALIVCVHRCESRSVNRSVSPSMLFTR